MSSPGGRKALSRGRSGPDRPHERGEALVIVALFATALAVFTVLTANVGTVLFQRTKLQAAADAAALAGAWALDFGTADAIAAAKLYAQNNGFTLQSRDVIVENSSRVRVKLSQPVGVMLGDAISKPSVTVGASALAQFNLVSRGLRPLGYPYQTTFEYGKPYVIKQSDKDLYGMVLNLDGTGASNYETALKYGSKNTFHIHQVVEQKSNGSDTMNGPTQRAVKFLLDKNPQGTYEQARQNPDTDPRVITIALVTPSTDDKKFVQIEGFARFFLVSEKHGDITAYFIDKPPGVTDRPATKYHANLTLDP